MKTRGFTLIELLAVIALLAAVMLLIYPNVLEKVQEKDDEIIEKKKQLIYSAAYDYLYENKDMYPVRAGKVYCVNMGYLGSLDRLPIDDYEDLIDGSVSGNYIVVKIGEVNNAYSISKSTTSCVDGIIKE